MDSTFSGVELGKRALMGHQVALHTVGHNLSNASTEGYSRQRVELRPSDALYRPQLNRAERPGQIGQGVDIARIERVRDELLDSRIVGYRHHQGYWQARDTYIGYLEQLHNEPSDMSLRGRLDKFWDSWQELSMFPEQSASRQAVLERGQTLADGMRDQHRRLTDLRTQVDDDIRGTTLQINSLSSNIAALNKQIRESEAAGDNPNDLYDQRDLRVEELAELLPITVEKGDPDEFMVHSGGVVLVQGKIGRTMDIVGLESPASFASLRMADTQGEFVPTGGQLGALIELRDVDLREELQDLNTFALTVSDLTNEIHSASYGLNGQTGVNFFTSYASVDNPLGNYDSNGDGAFDQTRLYRVSGSYTLDPQAQVGFSGVMDLPGPGGSSIDVPYEATQTVEDVLYNINNSGASVVARLDHNGRLEIKALAQEAPGPDSGADAVPPDFVLGSFGDSGEFLAGYSGILETTGTGAFNWNNPDARLAIRGDVGSVAIAPLADSAAYIRVNSELVQDPNGIAASSGRLQIDGDPGNGESAQALASLRTSNVMVGRAYSFDDRFSRTVARIGLKGEQAAMANKTTERIMKDFEDTRQSISGVNVDEELSNMIKFQHGYAAAARFINELDQMLDTIINRMGV